MSAPPAVRDFQQNENLSVDGIVGTQTWTALLRRWLLFSQPGQPPGAATRPGGGRQRPRRAAVVWPTSIRWPSGSRR